MDKFNELLEQYGFTEDELDFDHEGMTDEEHEAAFEEYACKKKKKCEEEDNDDESEVKEDEACKKKKKCAEDDDEEETYRVVTSVRADVLDGRVSNVSPIGRAIMGHKVGDRVQVVPEKGEPYYLVIRKIENTTDDGSFEIN